ncbi:MAG: L-serine ammonia-lyase, iron-sulfur-dependent, subunit alpha [Bacteroidales bacterium]|jgi:L-serine dehydratase|nr:L-serine ammonia-lyase, iron-sulfur-dependent, subunit alpha [Bacteroidales bacterium]
MNPPVSIFNDVLGPVMRGPSSSHTAAAYRISSLASQLAGDKVKTFMVDFSTDGSLATTYKGQGSDIGIAGGILGCEMESDNIVNSIRLVREMGVDLQFRISDYENDHPNTYKIAVTSFTGTTTEIVAVSTGGGMIRLRELNGFRVNVLGGYYEYFFYAGSLPESDIAATRDSLITKYPGCNIELVDIASTGESFLINIKASEAIDGNLISKIAAGLNAHKIQAANPVLPVLSRADCVVPFTSASELIKILPGTQTQLWEMALWYESQRGNIGKDEVWNLASGILKVMRASLVTGLAGTSYSDRILGRQSHLVDQAVGKGRILDSPLINTVIRNTTAVMESKSSYQPIVAAPTAGSCAVVPATLLSCADLYGFTEEESIKALLAAGMIGVFIATRSTFSAEVAGCQAECGAASAMAAAGVVQLLGGTAQEALNAASFALQNLLGLVCDPVAKRVEVPCLGKNILGATNAISAANITMSGFDTLIPLDEVIDSMDSIGHSLCDELCCTGKGGLSITPAAKLIEAKLKKR